MRKTLYTDLSFEIIITPNPGDILRKILFLDRDGTLIKDIPYLHKPEQVEWLSGVLSTMKILQIQGWEFVIVTNQSGIARGYYTEDDLHSVHSRMQEDFDRFNIKILRWNFCPHHPDITGSCECRKPLPGMIRSVLESEGVPPTQCALFGDKPSDVQAGDSAGVLASLMNPDKADSASQREFNSFGSFGSFLLRSI